MAAGEVATTKPRQEKQYDYLLKFLLVGDSDVGKQEILSGLDDGASESPFCGGMYANIHLLLCMYIIMIKYIYKLGHLLHTYS